MGKIISEEIIHSKRVAIKNDKGVIKTYEELYIEADKLNSELWHSKKNMVFVLCDQSIECTAFIFELIICEQVPFLLGADIPNEFVEKLIKTYSPGFIFGPRVKLDLSVRDSLGQDIGELHYLFRTTCEQPKLNVELALLMSTSGSTGSQKLVRLSYDNLRAEISQSVLELDIRCTDVGLTPMPIQFIYGFCFRYWHWFVGACVLVTDKMAISSEFEEFYERENTSCFAAVPHTWQMLERVEFWNENKLRSLKNAMVGGGRISDPDYCSIHKKMGNKFWNMYGQTECTGMIVLTNEFCVGGVGRPLRNIELSIDDKSGEIIVKGECVCMGYAVNAEELILGDENKGIIGTGDIAEIDEKGFIYLRGRKARFIKILDKRYSLDDVEKLLSEKFQGIDIACMGKDDDFRVYYVQAIIKESLGDEIIQYLNRALGIPVNMIKTIQLSELPRSSAGKVMYGYLS